MSEHTNTEHSILKAAEELFFEKGYKLATTTAIAEKAGVTHAMLHYYFRTKEQIFLKILDKNVNGMFRMLQTAMSPDLTVREILEEVVNLHYTFLSRHEKLPGLLFEIAVNNPEMLLRYKAMFQETVDTEIRKHKERFEKEISSGKMNRIDWGQMLFLMMSMNASTFLLLPAIRNAVGMGPDTEKAFLDERRKEIIRTLNARLFGTMPPED